MRDQDACPRACILEYERFQEGPEPKLNQVLQNGTRSHVKYTSDR